MLDNQEDKLAAEVLAHLRAKVREIGFSDLDSILEEDMFSLGLTPSVESLNHYYDAFDKYLIVFDQKSIEDTDAMLQKHLGNGYSWGLYSGGDPERRKSGSQPNDMLLDDLRRIGELAELRKSLRSVMEDIEVTPKPYNQDGMTPT